MNIDTEINENNIGIGVTNSGWAGEGGGINTDKGIGNLVLNNTAYGNLKHGLEISRSNNNNIVQVNQTILRFRC